MLKEQFSKITNPVVIIPFHFKSALLYHALIDAGIEFLGFWDNNAELNGETYDDVNITLPVPAHTLSRDVTLIVYYKKHESSIMAQLSELGYTDMISAQQFELEELEDYKLAVNEADISRIRPDFERALYKKNETIKLQSVSTCEEYIKRILPEGNARKILVISSRLEYSGAPIALYHLIKELKARGDIPVVFYICSGKLITAILEEDIPVLIDHRLPKDEWFIPLAQAFDLVIANTFSVLPIDSINKLNGLKIPVLWWLHETYLLYTQGLIRRLPEKLESNINVYCVGEYAKTYFLDVMPEVSAEILLYGIEDFCDAEEKDALIEGSSRIKIMTVGGIDYRKGQDIFCEAIRKLDPQTRNRCEFVFVGQAIPGTVSHVEVLALKKDFPGLVTLTGEVSRDEMKKVLHECDCMVCSSRDDPMPIFITEAMMFSKICICSENAGNSTLIEDGVNGFVYRNNDSSQLAEKLEYVVEHFAELDDMRKKSREIYDRYFSLDVFGRNVKGIIDKVCADFDK